MFWKLVLTTILCLLINVPGYGEETLRIGVLSKRGDNIAAQRWTSTATYLSQQVPGFQFVIVPLDFDAVSDAVQHNTIDFVITNTLYYSMLEHHFGVTRLVTLKNLGPHHEVLTNFGGVIFVRRDSPIQSLDQLNGKIFGAVEPNSFGGWVMARKELRNHGIEQEDFSKLRFLKTHDNVVYSVLDGSVDAGTVRTDTLERMAQEKLIDLNEIRILAPKTVAGFPYRLSTSLYPEWPFAALPTVCSDLSEQVLLALLKMPATSRAATDAKIAGWASPLDYSKVDALLYEFRLGPYANVVEEIIVKNQSITLSGVWNKEEIALAVLGLIVLGSLLYRYYTRTRLLDIKLSTFNILLIGFELVVILFLVTEIIILDRLEHISANATQDRYNMVSVADELRQSSDDLTHYARAYVVTGKPEFKQRYERILAIRNGSVPRPVFYENIYWDLNENIRKQRHPDGAARPLQAVIKSLPFSDTERRKLLQSEQNSNNLVNLEVQAFQEVQRGHTQQATALLFSDDYYTAKNNIMLPIDQMMALLNVRTQAEIQQINRQIRRQFHYLLSLSLIFVLGNLLAFWLLRKKVNQPVAYLTEVIRQFEQNRKKVPQKHFFNDEIGLMIDQYFSMQQTIHSANKQISDQKAFLNTLLNSQQQVIITLRYDETIISVNQAFYDRFDVGSVDDFYQTYHIQTLSGLFGYDRTNTGDIEDQYWLDFLLTQPSNTPYKIALDLKSGRQIFTLTVTRLPTDEQLYCVVLTDITEMEHAKVQIETLLNRMQESIEYASLIQNALIPKTDNLCRYFDDCFALWKPRDVVGGDIFLLEELNNEDEILLMVIDCTGHGVAGAFVTMLVKAIERQMVSTIQKSKAEVSPARLLSEFNHSIKQLLNQNVAETTSNAGFDGSIIYYNRQTNHLRYAGANSTLYLADGSDVTMIKGNRHSVGYKSSDTDYEFTDHDIEIRHAIQCYLPTDGFIDQNGGQKGFPFGKKNFITLIKQHHHQPMVRQADLFEQALKRYQGNDVVSDDMTLVAFRVSPFPASKS